MTKIGRNNPCPCGSGKKHKHCCGKEVDLGGPAAAVLQDPEWYKMRMAEAKAEYAIVAFAVEKYGDGALMEAIEEFCLWGDFEVDEVHIDPHFLPWVAFSWMPDTGEPVLRPLALDYLDEASEQLNEYEQRFVREACAQPFSFFVVNHAVQGKSLSVRDIFLDRTFTVREAKASRTLTRGDIIFARVVPLDGQAIFAGLAPIRIPPSEHVRLLDARDELKQEMADEGFELNAQGLVEWELEMRSIYLSVAKYLANPPLPQLQNTDGDPISFVTLYFDLHCPPQEAVRALSPLALYQSQEEILSDAIHDDDGNLVEVSFSWLKKGNKKHKSWDNTVMGTFRIKGDVLTAEVNSERRAKKIQAEVSKRLGNRAVFKVAVHESLDAKLEELHAQSGTAAFEGARREQEEFASRPEVKAMLKKQMEAHWKDWYDQRVPALGNKTPLEAARTKAGRERLEALLVEFERRNENVQPELRVDISAMRKKLGL
jgi:hypothetical protein